MHAAQVPHATAGVLPGIAVEQFSPIATPRRADTVFQARHGREIKYGQNRILVSAALAQQGSRARRAIVGVDGQPGALRGRKARAALD